MHRGVFADRARARVPARHHEPSGRLIYLTGGTTRVPRQIVYSDSRYRESVATTSQVLAAHGIGPKSRVLVSFPFDPWAIGGIFRDAALSCGAHVLPLGLHSLEPALQTVISEFLPNAVCGSVNVLLQLPGIFASHPTIFHAGEVLRATARAACETGWQAKVVNVFGMAEFDTVAAEGVKTPHLILCPELQYSLRSVRDQSPKRLAPDMRGELLIRLKSTDEWFRTFDRILVHGRVRRSEPLWPNSWCISHLGRSDSLLKLPDGSSLSEAQLEGFVDALGNIQEYQVQTLRPVGLPVLLRVVLQPSQTGSVCADSARQALLSGCLELSDSVSRGVAELRVVTEADLLVRTKRGKVKRFIEVDQ